jgi:predicted transposase YdaD
MKTDHSFYQLFQQFPESFFEMIGSASEAENYSRVGNAHPTNFIIFSRFDHYRKIARSLIEILA